MDCVLVSYKLSLETEIAIADRRHLKVASLHYCIACMIMKTSKK